MTHAPAPLSEAAIFRRSAYIAFLLQAALITAIGWQNHWLSHPQKTTGLDDSQFLEAQIFEVPEKAQLVSEEKIAAPKIAEAVISKVPHQGRKAKLADTAPPAEQNITTPAAEATPSVAPTHGPVAVFTPTPVLPPHLQGEDLQSAVVIEFLISAQGAVTPRLVKSSNNDELDALAIATAKKWQFRPAEDNHKAIDAKIRLRIEFEVK
jgi:TonB family protein